MPDLDDLADALYAAPPAGFVAARDEAVATARASGDRTGATAIAALRRPSTGAWLINLLAISRPDLVADFVALAGPLRRAQESLRGDELRALSAQRRAAIGGLVDEARTLAAAADPTLAKPPLAEVEATLSAALASEEIAAAVSSGRLVRTVSYAGFGEPPPPDVAGVGPVRRGRGGPAAGTGTATGRDGGTGRTTGPDGGGRAAGRAGSAGRATGGGGRTTGREGGSTGREGGSTGRDGGSTGRATARDAAAERAARKEALAAARAAETEARAAVDAANAAERDASAALADAADAVVLDEQAVARLDGAIADAERRLAALAEELDSMRAEAAGRRTGQRSAAKARDAAQRALEARQRDTHDAQERLFTARRRVADAGG